MDMSIVILWYLRWWIVGFINKSLLVSLYLWWSLALSIIMMKMCLLLSCLTHQWVSWLRCLRDRIFIFENYRYSSCFGFECLVQPTLCIELMIHISIDWVDSIGWGIWHWSSDDSYSSITTRRIGYREVCSKTFLQLAVYIDNVFILIELIFAILCLLTLLNVGALWST